MATNSNFDLSQRLYVVLWIFLLAVLVFFSFRIYDIWNLSKGNYPREISVEATGKSFVVPDTAKLNLGVHTESKTAESAVEENTKKMNAIMAELKKFKIAEKDIKTTNYYLNPNYKYTDEKGSYEDGYILDQNVEVTIKDFEKIGEIMTASTKTGANTIGGVTFEVDDTDTAKITAREQAIKKAKEKAKQIAKASGLKLGKVINYYEYEDGGGYPYYDGLGGGFEKATNDAAPPQIEPGEKEINLRVTLTYRVY